MFPCSVTESDCLTFKRLHSYKKTLSGCIILMVDDSNLKFPLTCSPNALREEGLGIPGEKEGNCGLGFYDNILLYINEKAVKLKEPKENIKTNKFVSLQTKILTANYFKYLVYTVQ